MIIKKINDKKIKNERKFLGYNAKFKSILQNCNDAITM